MRKEFQFVRIGHGTGCSSSEKATKIQVVQLDCFILMILSTFVNRCSIKQILSLILIIVVVLGVLAAVTTTVVLLTPQKRANTIRANVTLRWNSIGITVAGATGFPGNTSDRLSCPIALALDYSNALYIADSGNDRIQMYLPDSVVGKTVAGLGNGTGGSSLRQLNQPLGIQVDEARTLYISDASNARVLIWPKDSSMASIGVTGEFRI